MVLFSESRETILAQLVDDVLHSTNLTRTSVGSINRALLTALAGKLSSMYEQFDLNVAQALVHGANGQFLDLLGDMMGVHRINAEPARIAAVDQIQRFYVDSGTFGDINSGNDITLLSGTRISSTPDGGVSYFLTQQVILDKDASEAHVPMQSLVAGAGANAAAQQLRFHAFANYTDVANDSLKTINDFELAYGQDAETDANFRYRIVNSVVGKEAANAIAIRLAVLTTPGVADVQLIKFYAGIGSFDAVIKSVTPSTPARLLEAVRFNIDRVQAFGTKVFVRGPVEVGVSVIGSLKPRRKLSAQEETNLLNAVTQNVTDYLNGLDIGEGFYINEIVERVMGTSTLIRDMGQPNKPLDEVYIYTPTELNDNKIRASLVANYLPMRTDEKVLVENVYAGNTPILFRVVY